MAKAVLISIQPKWCELIASGKKTVEVRKTQPKLETPFKCYIYMTSGDASIPDGKGMVHHHSGGRCVIGEFVCDGIYAVLAHPDIFAGHPMFYDHTIKAACLTNEEVERYSEGKDLCGWHISGLVIYDRAKKLSEFMKPCGSDLYCESCAMFSESRDLCGNKARVLYRAPQSWCYVDELKGGDEG